MKKGAILTYHSATSILNEVQYKIVRLGAKKATLEPVYNQAKLIGLPTFRQPFNINPNDLNEAIEAGIYTIN